MSSLKPICIPCQRFYRCKLNGFYFLEGMPISNGQIPGKSNPDGWVPYKLWVGDIWQCPDCKHELISGVGNRPLAEHYESNFKENTIKLSADKFMVKDC